MSNEKNYIGFIMCFLFIGISLIITSSINEDVDKCFPNYESANTYNMTLKEKCINQDRFHGTLYKFIFVNETTSILYIEYDMYEGSDHYVFWETNKTYYVTVDKYNNVLNVE